MESKLDQILQELQTFKSDVRSCFKEVDLHLKGEDIKSSVVSDFVQGSSLDSSTGQRDSHDHGDHVAAGLRQGGLHSQSHLDVPSGFSQVDTEPLQARFRSIKDSVSGQRLSDDLYFGGKVSGIDKSARDTAAVLSSTSRYMETALKLTGSLSSKLSGTGANQQLQQLDDLTVTLVACMRLTRKTGWSRRCRDLWQQSKTCL